MPEGEIPALDMLTVSEAAAETGIHAAALRRAIAAGRLKARRLGQRLWVIERRDFAAWLAERGPAPKE